MNAKMETVLASNGGDLGVNAEILICCIRQLRFKLLKSRTDLGDHFEASSFEFL
jgi:hypothetical protein